MTDQRVIVTFPANGLQREGWVNQYTHIGGPGRADVTYDPPEACPCCETTHHKASVPEAWLAKAVTP